MKYRRLTNDELKELENEFIGFLAANSITGKDWELLKKKDQDKTEGLIEQFSEIVMQKVLEKIKYLELRMPKDWKVFHCGNDQIELIALAVNENSDLDLTKQISSDDLSDGATEIYKAEKAYHKPRTEEIFDMIENGCSISNAEIFEMMQSLLE